MNVWRLLGGYKNKSARRQSLAHRTFSRSLDEIPKMDSDEQMDDDDGVALPSETVSLYDYLPDSQEYELLKSENQNLNHHLEKYQKYPEKIKRLEQEKKKLDYEQSQLVEELDYFKKITVDYKNQVIHLKSRICQLQDQAAYKDESFRKEHKKFGKEKQRLKDDLDNLQALHIRSVNNVGTGLEPICDRDFQEKFNTMHFKVNAWCRKAFLNKGAPKKLADLGETLKLYLGERIFETNSLNHGQLMDTIAWSFMEAEIFRLWYPVGGPVVQGLDKIDENLRTGNEILDEKTDFWRAYTASLLFQNTRTWKGLDQLAFEMSSKLCQYLHDVQLGDDIEIKKESKKYLTDIIKSVIKLAAELKCQRGYYEVDDNIRPGDKYDKSRMQDMSHTVGDEEDEDSDWTVSCIISKGWIKRSFLGSNEVIASICKARVLVADPEN